jgi:hypothetical protein
MIASGEACEGTGSNVGSPADAAGLDHCEEFMKMLLAMLVCLPFAWIEGCQSRSAAEIDALNARLQAEQVRSAELNQRANQAAAAKAAAEKQVAELSAQLDAAKKQLAGEQRNVEKLARELDDAERSALAAEEQSRKAAADNDLLKAKLGQRGTLQNIDDTMPPDAEIPDEIRNAFRNALAWRANQIRSLEIEIRDTPSKAEARAMQARLDKLRSSPVTAPPLSPSDLTLGQIGPLKIDDHLRVDEIVDGTTLVVTPIKLDPSLTQQTTAAGSDGIGPAAAGTAFVREEGNPIAIHGFPTKGAVTGAKITELPGLYFVEKTQRYGSRTIFVLAPVDANKLHAYFSRLQAELRAAANSKPRDNSRDSSEAAAK